MARASKTQEGILYRYEDGKLILTSCPQEIASLDFSVPFEEGAITGIEVQFRTSGVQGNRFFAAKELILPETLKKFPRFGRGFSNIKKLDIPMSCKALSHIVLPDSVKVIGKSAFEECKRFICRWGIIRGLIVMPEDQKTMAIRFLRFFFIIKAFGLPMFRWRLIPTIRKTAIMRFWLFGNGANSLH